MGSSEEFDFSRLSEAPERATDRNSMFLQAEVIRTETGDRDMCRVRNVSRGGAMAETQKRYQQGEKVVVTLRNVGEVRGEIAWIANNRIGIAFEVEVDPRLVRASSKHGH